MQLRLQGQRRLLGAASVATHRHDSHAYKAGPSEITGLAGLATVAIIDVSAIMHPVLPERERELLHISCPCLTLTVMP